MCFYISQRFILSLLAFFGVLNVYLMRVNLSVEILGMAEPPKTTRMVSIFEFTVRMTR